MGSYQSLRVFEPQTLISMVLNSEIAQEHLVYLTENTIHRLQIIGITP